MGWLITNDQGRNLVDTGLRLPIPYIDPKVSDNTPAEAATYDERSRQIAREMFYLVSTVRIAPLTTASR